MVNPTTRLHLPEKLVTSLRSPSFKHFVLETRGFGDKINKLIICHLSTYHTYNNHIMNTGVS
jgi:hypothetical protein